MWRNNRVVGKTELDLAPNAPQVSNQLCRIGTLDQKYLGLFKPISYLRREPGVLVEVDNCLFMLRKKRDLVAKARNGGSMRMRTRGV